MNQPSLNLLHYSDEKSFEKEPLPTSSENVQNITTLNYTGMYEKIAAKMLNSNDTCVNVTRPKNTTYASTGRYWHLQKRGKEEIMVYSTFYDNRPPVGELAIIRLLVVATLSKSARVFCYIWYANVIDPYVIPVTIISSGAGDRLFGVFYGQWLYSCQLPFSYPIPTHVSLSTSSCGQSDILVPVSVPAIHAKIEHEFGVCVSISFGEYDFAIISEWLEFSRLFGVTEVNIYNASMPIKMNRIFDVYKRTGLLQVHQMPPPVPDYSGRGSSIGSPASLNDCMLRNAYRYRYIVVIDLDEMIIPRKHSNYSSMLKAIDQASNLSEPSISYTFRNLYFLKDIASDQNQPEYLTTMRYRKRAKTSGYLFGPKSLINPLYCLSVFNHYCWVRFPGIAFFTVDVPTDLAMSHHYKVCGFSKEKCASLVNESFQDDFMLQFKPQIDIRVRLALKSSGYSL